MALLLLVSSHMGFLQLPTKAGSLLGRVTQPGWFGTDLFLVIAGYLTAESLLRRHARGTGAWLSYLEHRARRVVPIYVAFLVLYLYALPWVLRHVFPGLPTLRPFETLSEARGAPSAFLWTLSSNLYLALSGKGIGAALEALFAIGVGAQATLVVSACLIFLRGRARWLALLLLVAACEVTRVLSLRHPWPYFIYAFPLTRAEPFVLGALASLGLRTERWRPWLLESAPRFTCFGAAALTVFAAATHSLSIHVTAVKLLGYPAVALLSTSAVIAVVTRKATSSVPSKLLSRILLLLAKAAPFTFAAFLFKLPYLSSLWGIVTVTTLPAPVQFVVLLVLAFAGLFAVAFLFRLGVEGPLTRGFLPGFLEGRAQATAQAEQARFAEQREHARRRTASLAAEKTAEATRAFPSTSPAFDENTRLSTLDGLRGAASLAVVIYHFARVAGLPELEGSGKWLGRLLATGWIGVDVFFVLSGFLITSILLEKPGAPNYYKAFFARRLLRVVPLYWVFLALYLSLGPWFLSFAPATEPLKQSIERSRDQLPWLWSYTGNLWMVATKQLLEGALQPVWSLCVEIHFYLAWPFLIRAVPRRTLAKILVVALIALPLLRVGLLAAHLPARSIYFLTFTRLDPIIVGTLVAIARKEPRARNWLAGNAHQGSLLGLSLLGLLWLLGRGIDELSTLTVVGGYSIIAVASGALLVAALDGPSSALLSRVLASPPLRMAGELSYAVYLFNLPVFTAIALLLPPPQRAPLLHPLALLGLTLPVLFGMAKVSALVIERPSMGLRRWFPWYPPNRPAQPKDVETAAPAP
jgi:peptidoglycan/LPS O-acetylase OafA/YrhL